MCPRCGRRAMLINTLGSVIKMRLGLASGEMPKEKQAGKMIKPRADGHKGVQHADAHGLTGQGKAAVHVAAENFHGGNAQAQGEEGLVHRGGDDVAEPLLAGALPSPAAGRRPGPPWRRAAQSCGRPAPESAPAERPSSICRCAPDRLCRPNWQTRKPASTVMTTIQSTMLAGVGQHIAEHLGRRRRGCRPVKRPVRQT